MDWQSTEVKLPVDVDSRQAYHTVMSTQTPQRKSCQNLEEGFNFIKAELKKPMELPYLPFVVLVVVFLVLLVPWYIYTCRAHRQLDKLRKDRLEIMKTRKPQTEAKYFTRAELDAADAFCWPKDKNNAAENRVKGRSNKEEDGGSAEGDNIKDTTKHEKKAKLKDNIKFKKKGKNSDGSIIRSEFSTAV